MEETIILGAILCLISYHAQNITPQGYSDTVTSGHGLLNTHGTIHKNRMMEFHKLLK